MTTKRVWALIKAGRLPSRQYGRDHLINESDLALVADRKPGRPKTKPAEEGETEPPTGSGTSPPKSKAAPTKRARKKAAKKASKKGKKK